MKINLLSPAISILAHHKGVVEKTDYSFFSKVEGKHISLSRSLDHQPHGLRSMVTKAGIKYPDVLDFGVVSLDQPGTAAGVFTKNRSASPAVQIDRDNLKNGQAQALAVISKNANVFTPTALEDSEEIIQAVALKLGIQPEDVLTSCTGVIGVPLPMEKVRAGIEEIPYKLENGLSDDFSEAILTTDNGPKIASIKFGDAVIAGVAKGAGMIEPNMATMLVYFFSNISLPHEDLKCILKNVCDSTFNSISVDTDTSTSDSVIAFLTNEIEPTKDYRDDFESALGLLSLKLSQEIVSQGEGSTKLIQVNVKEASSSDNAKKIAKQIVNSPLVKTAIYGADPNWGRVVMAMGKPLSENEATFNSENIKISIADMTLFDHGKSTNADLSSLSKTLSERQSVEITVELGEGKNDWTVWGCDLSKKYVEINAEYTT